MSFFSSFQSRISTACYTLSRCSRPHLVTRPASRRLHNLKPATPPSYFSYATQAAAPTSTGSDKLPATPAKNATDSEKTFTPKIEELVQSIGQLSLLEAAELVDALKSRLKITEAAMPVHSASHSGSQPSASGDGESKPKKQEPQKPKEKTAFTLILTQIDAAQKAKVIKEVKTIMPNMNLVEAKKFVESLPKQLKENGTKEEIEKLKKALESVGATVKVE